MEGGGKEEEEEEGGDVEIWANDVVGYTAFVLVCDYKTS